MNQHTDISIQHHFDRMEITRLVDEIDNAVDAKDWERCRSYFTDEIHADFTSLAGGAPGNMPADNLVGAWRTNLYADKLSHHMRSNHRITIDGQPGSRLAEPAASGSGSAAYENWSNARDLPPRTPYP